MKADFSDAHERHWADAELLREHDRLANADHLYGIAAECGLKALMLAFGMQVDPETGSPQDRKDRRHIMEKGASVWDRYEAYSEGRSADYALPAQNPFSNWEAGQRYAHREAFNQDRIEAHRQGYRLIRRLVRKYELENGTR